MRVRTIVLSLAVALISGIGATGGAQSNLPKENFSAIAIQNNDLGSGAGRLLIRVTRWSSAAERDRLANVLLEKGQDGLVEALRKVPSTGTIRTPDSLAYDLRYAYQQPGEDGGRDIVLATDRPMSFWELRNQPRTVDYPLTVIQFRMDKDGVGKGTMSYATKILVAKGAIALENFGTAPIMLTEVRSEPAD